MEIKLQLNLLFKNENGAFTKRKKPKMKVINLKLMSIHTRGKFEEQQYLQEFVVDKLQNNKHAVVIGQDSNARIRKCNETYEDGEMKIYCMGRHGMDRRDAKREQLVEFLQACNLFVLNIFHEAKSHATHKVSIKQDCCTK